MCTSGGETFRSWHNLGSIFGQKIHKNQPEVHLKTRGKCGTHPLRIFRLSVKTTIFAVFAVFHVCTDGRTDTITTKNPAMW